MFDGQINKILKPSLDLFAKKLSQFKRILEPGPPKKPATIARRLHPLGAW